jgi:lysophospholipase L1-like esterase
VKLKKNSTLLMVGDSITDADRNRNDDASLGSGYVSFVDALLGSVYHDYRIRVLNRGISGNTVRDLEHRWQSDVLDIKADWLSVMIGINDVWRQFDTPQNTASHVKIGEYEATLNALIETVRGSIKGLVLMTPFYIEPRRDDPMRAMMDQYGKVVKCAAACSGAIFVDTQKAFNTALRTHYSSALAWDRIHPKPIGAMILARAFLRAIDFDWDRR